MSVKEVEILRAACAVAGLDQRISPEERKVLQMLADRIGVGEMSLNAMMARATKDQAFFQEMFTILRHDPEETMKTMVAVAMADGELIENERVVLHHFSGLLGLSEARFEVLIQAAEEYCKKKKAGG